MSQHRKTGGTAFPMQDPQAIHAYASALAEKMYPQGTSTDDRDRVYTQARADAVGGMSLRDYFAAKAMQALIIHGNNVATAKGEALKDAIAHQAYDMADAMLKAGTA